MNDRTGLLTVESIRNCVYTVRGQQVILDSDLADIYGYEDKRLNEQVKRNINRFPEDFMFQLTRDEVDLVKPQNATSRENTFFLDKVEVVENFYLPLPNRAFIC